MPGFFIYRLAAVCIVMAAALFLVPAHADTAQSTISTARISSDTVWSGRVLVEKVVTVDTKAKLSIKPGTRILFQPNSGLTVEGRLNVEGTQGAVVTFTSSKKEPAAGDWAGINFNNCRDGSVLRYCRIEYAGELTATSCSPVVEHCEIINGMKGLTAISRKSAPVVRDNVFRNMGQGGVECRMGATPVITGNTVEKCGPFGISSTQESFPSIKGNKISGCEAGIFVSKTGPPIEGNVLKDNQVGIMLTLAGPELAVRGNKLDGNQTGIVCQQFSSPLIEKNTITGSSQGLVCFRASSPNIRNNEISGNEEGISCIQLCNPSIKSNSVHNNKKGIYLDLSSYAVINNNNIYANEVQIELGNMSSDWENKVNKKPARGSQAQNLTQAQRGIAVAQPMKDDAVIMGFVDAKGNWWGESVTKEMDKKGPDANIARFIDYYDVPVRTYEGYEGEYVQDRVNYTGWKKSMIEDAGL